MRIDNEQFRGVEGVSPENGVRQFCEKRYPDQIAADYLSVLPLPIKADGTPVKHLKNAIRAAQKQNEKLIIVSTVCPSYSANEQGTPDYNDLETGISPNTERHLTYLPIANGILRQSNVDYVHFFLMADTEVDLLPFLTKLNITPEQFTAKCQESVDILGNQVSEIYGDQPYQEEGVPQAARFLDYFGAETWFPRYEKYLNRLLAERQAEPRGKVARSLEYDYGERRVLISKLLGTNISYEEGVAHIARQKAQYMAFASLMREKFGERLVIVNHRTPNFAWMNNKIAREPENPEELAKNNYHHQLALIELDISTLPEE